MSEPTLTEEDREALREAHWPIDPPVGDHAFTRHDRIEAAVERIVARHRAEAAAAALRPVEALRHDWYAADIAKPYVTDHVGTLAEDLADAITQGREDAR